MIYPDRASGDFMPYPNHYDASTATDHVEIMTSPVATIIDICDRQLNFHCRYNLHWFWLMPSKILIVITLWGNALDLRHEVEIFKVSFPYIFPHDAKTGEIKDSSGGNNNKTKTCYPFVPRHLGF